MVDAYCFALDVLFLSGFPSSVCLPSLVCKRVHLRVFVSEFSENFPTCSPYKLADELINDQDHIKMAAALTNTFLINAMDTQILFQWFEKLNGRHIRK